MLDEDPHGLLKQALKYFDTMLDDDLEHALAEDPVSVIPSAPVATVSPDTPISEAIQKLGAMEIGCLLVVEHDQLIGIFTERDVLNRVAERYERIKDQPISNVMTRSPSFAYESDPSGAALTVMAANGYRHVPIVDSAGRLVGIVSPRRVADFVMTHIGT